MLSVVNCLFDNYFRYLSFTKVEHSTQSLVWTCKLSERSWRSFFWWCTHVLSYKWQMDDIFWTAHMLSVCIHIDNPRGSISQSLHCSFLNLSFSFCFFFHHPVKTWRIQILFTTRNPQTSGWVCLGLSHLSVLFFSCRKLDSPDWKSKMRLCQIACISSKLKFCVMK